jgi:bifunctional non-homologous end joining protein LigD
MLPASSPDPFDSTAHIFEVLWDGIRAVAFLEDGEIRIQDRWGRDITHRYPELGAMAGSVRENGAVIDGEIVSLDDDGMPSFCRLRPRLGVDDPALARDLADAAPVTFQAFDLLYREHQPVTGWPLRRRKEMLLKLVRPRDVIDVPDWVARDGVAFFEAARDHGLEGVVAKEVDSRYVPGERIRSWLTVRVYRKSRFLIGGYTYGGEWNPRGTLKKRPPVSSLLIGRLAPDGRLRFAGEVRGGFSPADAREIARQLDEIASPACPFDPATAASRLVFWCRPELAVTVRYAGHDATGELRFPVFEALRPDVPAESCTDEDA